MSAERVTVHDVRSWARKRGLTVGQRGHLPTAVVDAYNAAHTEQFANPNPWLRPMVNA